LIICLLIFSVKESVSERFGFIHPFCVPQGSEIGSDEELRLTSTEEESEEEEEEEDRKSRKKKKKEKKEKKEKKDKKKKKEKERDKEKDDR